MGVERPDAVPASPVMIKHDDLLLEGDLLHKS